MSQALLPRPPSSRDTSEFSDLAERLPTLRTELAEAEGKAAALRQMIAGIEVLCGLTPTNGAMPVAIVRDQYGPRGTRAFVRVLDTAPQKIWKLSEIRRELLARGWAPSTKAVDAQAKRCLQAGWVESPRYGYYRLTTSDCTQSLPVSASDRLPVVGSDKG